MRRVVLLFVYVALAITAVVLVTGDDTQNTGDDTQSTAEVTPRTGGDARSRTLSRVAAEDLIRNFRNQSNRNVRGTRVRCRAADEEGWLCSYFVGGKTCTGEVSGTPDDPEINLFCGSKGS